MTSNNIQTQSIRRNSHIEYKYIYSVCMYAYKKTKESTHNMYVQLRSMEAQTTKQKALFING